MVVFRYSARCAGAYLGLMALFFVVPTAYSTEVQPGHTEIGTKYGESGIQTYAEMKHGPDGALFLDPYFIPYLMGLEGQVLLDAGCGAGSWSIFAARNGAIVHGIDIQPGMIDKARQSALDWDIDDSATFIVGDVGALPYEDGFFDVAISLNVGCNLPDLSPHLRELSRVLKVGGTAVITAPTSFGTVFTDGSKSFDDVINSIEECLSGQQGSPMGVQQLDEIYRATFANKQGIWSLIQDEAELDCGEEIWRKIPGMMVPNRYHSEEEYLSLLSKYGFHLTQVYRPRFGNEQEREAYNSEQQPGLSQEYVAFPAFVIFIARKSAANISR